MATGTQDVESALIESVCERVRERVAPEEVAEAEAFVRAATTARAPAADLRGREPVDLYGAALSHWTFGRGPRRRARSRVRAYNPTFEQHGWQSPHTAIDIVCDDMPFLVDSVSMELSRRETGIHVLVHPVVGDESYMHIEVDRQARRASTSSSDALRGVLAQVRAAVEDWQPMRERMEALVDEPPPAGVDPAEVEEARALLAWLCRPPLHVPRLPRVRARRRGRCAASRAPGLGLLRGGSGDVSSAFAKLPPAVRALAREPDAAGAQPRPTRARRSTGPSYLDYIGVKRFDDDGNVVGERRFLGLYTTAAYREVPANIPVLRRKAQAVVERAGLPARQPRRQGAGRGHRHVPARRAVPDRGRRARTRSRAGSSSSASASACGCSCARTATSASSPASSSSRATASTPPTGSKIGEILREALGAETVDWGLRLTEWVLVRIHYTLRMPPGELPAFDVAELEARIVEATRSWDDELQDALLEEVGEETGTALFRRYGVRVPGRLPRRPARALGDRRRAADRGAGGRARRSTSASTGRSRRRPACCAASSTGAASACRCPTCCRCSRASG